ncbi:hypothetical protein KCTC32516_01715 [Polaribacter huanghezhanensis]|uniref:hypothetical protein n=1 Tax=Polaribacter huanghezhanensis TaxID=1354726 RepID=UPI002649B1E3|nr:hypothetical protein [Polaribacter huanghezhanensis]WKD86340.1 hypothetical protein KCTC32516_01715 [Polaribacter huanghezhanensis]
MLKKFSIEHHKETILKPNSEFERRIILQYYLDTNISINTIERGILIQTNVSEPESIGIIGCLLNDNSKLNTLRLAIGAKNRSNKKLSELSASLFTLEHLKSADSYYFLETHVEDLSEIENVINREYSLLYY